MEFLTTGEKIKKLRKQLGLKQHELEEANITRSFISMVENDKKGLSKETAKALADIFNRKAIERDLELNVDDKYLTCQPEVEAEKYCLEKLKGEVSELSIEALDELVQAAKKYNLKAIIEKAYLLKGNKLYDAGNFVEAFTCYNEILEMHLNSGSEEKLAFVYNKIAKCKIELLSYDEAIAYLNKAYSYAAQYDDNQVIKYALYNLALCYKLKGEYDESLKYVNQFTSLCSLEKEFDMYISGIILTYNCYTGKGETDKAIHLYSEAINNFSDTMNPLLGYLYNNLGVLYSKLNDIHKALENFKKAQDIRSVRDRSSLPYTLIYSAKLYIKLNDLEKANELINEAFNVENICKDKLFLIQAHELLEEIYSIKGDWSNLEKVYQSMIETLKDSNDKMKALKIRIKMSLLYLNNDNVAKAKECLEQSLINVI